MIDYLLAFVKSSILKRPLAAGLELTYKCNLNCPMCYFQSTKPNSELTDREMIGFMQQMRKDGIIHATLVGGEPTLRASLINAAAEIFPYTWVITNGTTDIKKTPIIKNVLYGISVDGTQKSHDLIRMPGLYKKIYHNWKDRSDCFTTTTICDINKNDIPDLVKQWSQTKIAGMTFNFATPIKGNKDVFISWEERHRVIEQLKNLKKEYGDFLWVSDRMLDLLKRNAVAKWHKNCLIKTLSISYQANGLVKKPCILGSLADCSQCGCHISPTFLTLKQLDLRSIKVYMHILKKSRN